MIYITGDTHGEFARFTPKSRFRTKYRPTEEDYVMVCGDFGLLWNRYPGIEKEHQKIFEELPFRVLWIQGNHDNYDMIEEYPTEFWNGGMVRQIIRDKVILLERGQIFTIEGKRFFTFGGASCHDVQGGILDPDDEDFEEKLLLARKARSSGKPFRIKGVSWWEQELPTSEEMETGLENLKQANWQVDYVISHCPSGSILRGLIAEYGWTTFKEDRLTEYFDELESKVRYKKWFFGHLHSDMQIDSRHQMLYVDIVPIR